MALLAALPTGRRCPMWMASRSADGDGVVRTPDRVGRSRGLDEYRVGWELIDDWDRYQCFGRGRAAIVQLSRGCPHRCTYCGQHAFWKRWRHRDPEALADEIAWLHREHGVRFVTLADENPTTLTERLAGLPARRWRGARSTSSSSPPSGPPTSSATPRRSTSTGGPACGTSSWASTPPTRTSSSRSASGRRRRTTSRPAGCCASTASTRSSATSSASATRPGPTCAGPAGPWPCTTATTSTRCTPRRTAGRRSPASRPTGRSSRTTSAGGTTATRCSASSTCARGSSSSP